MDMACNDGMTPTALGSSPKIGQHIGKYGDGDLVNVAG